MLSEAQLTPAIRKLFSQRLLKNPFMRQHRMIKNSIVIPFSERMDFNKSLTVGYTRNSANSAPVTIKIIFNSRFFVFISFSYDTCTSSSRPVSISCTFPAATPGIFFGTVKQRVDIIFLDLQLF